MGRSGPRATAAARSLAVWYGFDRRDDRIRGSSASTKPRGLLAMSRQSKILEVLKSRSWREAILSALSAWNRNQVGRVVAAVVLTWLVGAVGPLPGRAAGRTPTSPPGPIRSGASGSCSSAASISPRRRRPGGWSPWSCSSSGSALAGPVHGEPGLPPGRTLPAEARRVHLRDGRPPGPVQLVPARAGVDPRGPRQDHPGQAPGRHHPRRARRDRPARQAGRGRPSATSTSSRGTRPAR